MRDTLTFHQMLETITKRIEDINQKLDEKEKEGNIREVDRLMDLLDTNIQMYQAIKSKTLLQ